MEFNLKNKRASQQIGFTLLEVLIAVALLAVLSLLVSQSTLKSFDIKGKLGKESDENTVLAISLQTLENDIAQIYTPFLATEKKTDSTNAESPGEFWSAKVRSDGFRRARFVGSNDKISFISNGNHRFRQDVNESDFLKVVWEVEKNKESFSLTRTISSIVYNYEDKGAKQLGKTPLLENVSSGKFTFYRSENKTWENQWDSENSFAKPENRYPDLIALELEVSDPINSVNKIKWKLVSKPNRILNFEDEAKRKEKLAKSIEEIK